MVMIYSEDVKLDSNPEVYFASLRCNQFIFKAVLRFLFRNVTVVTFPVQGYI